MKALLAGSELCRNLGDEARSGGVVCRRFEDLDAVFESDTCDNLGQVICAFQPPPGFRCGDNQFEHHQPGGVDYNEPFVRTVLCRTVANTLSMGFVVLK
jgi:hypothetical protein